MDRSAYPFNGAPIKRSNMSTGGFAGSQFPLRNVNLKTQDQKLAASWDASTVWFDDVLTQTWANDPDRQAAVARSKRAKAEEESRLSSTFPRAVTGAELEKYGVSGAGKSAQVQRQYRQLVGARLLKQVGKLEAPERPEMLGPRTGPPRREFVLVAKDELSELHALEALLQKEQGRLGAQALFAIGRGGVSACEPLPLVKMAVEDACNREMKHARAQVELLSRERCERKAGRERKALGYELGAVRSGGGGGGGSLRHPASTQPLSKQESVVLGVVPAGGQWGLHGQLVVGGNAGTGFNGNVGKNSNSGICGGVGDSNGGGGCGSGGGTMFGGGVEKKGPSYATLVLNPNRHRKRKVKLNARPHRGGGGAGGGGGGLAAAGVRLVESLRHAEVKAGACEREEMGYEERIQRFADVYTEASERKMDYQWYYVLACRYGPLSEAEFGGGPRPGGIYLSRTGQAARGVQRLWRFFWPLKQAAMHRGALGVQTAARKYLARIKWWPVIKFRCLHGRLKLLQSMLRQFRANVKRNMRIRHLLKIAEFGYGEKCVRSWKTFTRERRLEKEAKALACLKKIKNAMANKVFTTWRTYAKRNGDVKRLMKRTLGSPCFATWVTVASMWKHERATFGLANTLQRCYRGKLGRRRAATAKWLLEKLKWVSRGKQARLDVGKKLAQQRRVMVGAGVFERQEAYVSSLVARDLELREQLVAGAKGAARALEERVTHYLTKTSAGKKEWQEMARVRMEERLMETGVELSAEQAKDEVRGERVKAAKRKARGIARHDLLAQARKESNEVSSKAFEKRALPPPTVSGSRLGGKLPTRPGPNKLPKKKGQKQRGRGEASFFNAENGANPSLHFDGLDEEEAVEDLAFELEASKHETLGTSLWVCPNPQCGASFPTECHFAMHGPALKGASPVESIAATAQSDSAAVEKRSPWPTPPHILTPPPLSPLPSEPPSPMSPSSPMPPLSSPAALAAKVSSRSKKNRGGRSGGDKSTAVAGAASGAVAMEPCPGCPKASRDVIHLYRVLLFRFAERDHDESEDSDDDDDDDDDNSDEDLGDEADKDPDYHDEEEEEGDKRERYDEGRRRIVELKKRAELRTAAERKVEGKRAEAAVGSGGGRKGVQKRGRGAAAAAAGGGGGGGRGGGVVMGKGQRAAMPAVSGSDRIRRFVEQKEGLRSGGALLMLRFVESAEELKSLPQGSARFDDKMADLCDKFLDPDTAGSMLIAVAAGQPTPSLGAGAGADDGVGEEGEGGYGGGDVGAVALMGSVESNLSSGGGSAESSSSSSSVVDGGGGGGGGGLCLLNTDTAERCLLEADSLREHTTAGRRALVLQSRGYLSRLLFGGPRKHGDPWGDGKRDPTCFFAAQWEGLLLLHARLKALGWWGSEACEGWRDDALRLSHASEERLTARVLFDFKRRAVREGRRHRAVAVAREQDRSQRFDDLFTRAMDRAVSSLEEEVLTNELWVVTHELAHQWNLWSGAVAAQLLDDTVDWCVESAVEKHVSAELAEEWAELGVELVLENLMLESIHREIGSKVLIEAALSHGLRVEAKTRPLRLPNSGLSLVLGVKGPGHADFEAFTAGARVLQGMYRRRKARGRLRKLLASVWRKRWDAESYSYFYDNTINGEMQWEAPKAFRMFFPDSNW